MKSLSITLYLSEILYDIRNKAFLTGRSRETADNQAQISWSQLSGDEPEMGQIMRSVESALAVVQTKLAPYLEEITRERILREHHPPRHRRPHPAEPIELPAEDDVLMPSEEHAITLQLQSGVCPGVKLLDSQFYCGSRVGGVVCHLAPQ